MSASGAAMFAPLDGPAKVKSSKGKGSGRGEWVAVTPIPSKGTGPRPKGHFKLGLPSRSWTYRNADGRVLGYTHRWNDGAGGKQFAYQTFCRHSESGACAWRFKAWQALRPIYGLDRLAKRAEAPVLVVEGEGCADTAQKLLPDWVCITSPGGSNAASKADWGPLAGREIWIWPDADEAGSKYREAVAHEAIRAGAKRVQVVEPPAGVPGGWDVDDAVKNSWERPQIDDLIGGAVPFEGKSGHRRSGSGADKTAEGTNTASKGRRRGPPQRDRIIGLIDDAELWHDESGDAFASILVGNHVEHWPLRSRPVKRHLAGRFYQDCGGAVGGQAMEDALRVLDAIATEEGPCHPWSRRTALIDGRWYLNMCTPDWRVVEVGPDGWSMVDSPHAKFVRSAAMRSLPEPEGGRSIDDLRGFVNVPDDASFAILVAWLIAALWGVGPFPILTLAGEQGAGKSNLARVLRSLVDPNSAPIRSTPRDERDLVVAALNSHVLAFDNLSGISGWLSDALCRIATGGGFGTRALYGDVEEVVIAVQRPIILNGIADLASRADLADRSMSLYLPTIPQEQRRPESEFWHEFEAAKPGILGALLDGVSSILRHLPDVKLDRLPRLADFARVIEAASPGLGWEPGRFLEVYDENRRDMTDTAFAADPIAVAVAKFIESHGGSWEGTATHLLTKINEVVPEATRKSRFWPGSPSAMGSALRRAAPLLRGHGLEVFMRHSGSRLIRLGKADG